MVRKGGLCDRGWEDESRPRVRRDASAKRNQQPDEDRDVPIEEAVGLPAYSHSMVAGGFDEMS